MSFDNPRVIPQNAKLERLVQDQTEVLSSILETLEEINEEIKDSFVEAGGEGFTYIPCLNDDEDHIAALCGIIDENLTGWVSK